jgi:hypothetical protein
LRKSPCRQSRCSAAYINTCFFPEKGAVKKRSFWGWVKNNFGDCSPMIAGAHPVKNTGRKMVRPPLGHAIPFAGTAKINFKNYESLLQNGSRNLC